MARQVLRGPYELCRRRALDSSLTSRSMSLVVLQRCRYRDDRPLPVGSAAMAGRQAAIARWNVRCGPCGARCLKGPDQAEPVHRLQARPNVTLSRPAAPADPDSRLDTAPATHRDCCCTAYSRVFLTAQFPLRRRQLEHSERGPVCFGAGPPGSDGRQSSAASASFTGLPGLHRADSPSRISGRNLGT